MKLTDFLSLLSPNSQEYLPGQIGASIRVFEDRFPDLDELDLALISISEERGNANTEQLTEHDSIRKAFYSLYEGSFSLRMADLGMIKRGERAKDSYIALQQVVDELLSRGIVPIILGGSHDLTYAQYQAYASFEKKIDLGVIDASIDLDLVAEIPQAPTANSFLNSIFTNEPNYLFNYAAIGFQTYFVPQAALQLLNKLYFDSYRLGEVRSTMREMEPVLRDCDLLSIDLSAIRAAENPGCSAAGPNGLTADEICQLCKYAGASEKLTSLGIYEYHSSKDRDGQTALLVAEMIWCFTDGFYQRKKEHPIKDKQAFLKYVTATDKGDYEIVFFKSKLTEKWWMQVPSPKNSANERSYLTPCSYADYELASRGELPDRWWRLQQKLV